MRLRAAILIGLASLAPAGSGLAQDARGSAEAAPYALYAEWAKGYGAAKVSLEAVDHQSVLEHFVAGGADFAGLDLPLSVAQLAARGLVQFPTAVGGVVPIVNVPGVVPGALRLNGAVLADMFLGRIKSWNDPALAALNPGLALPDSPVRPVHLAEASGDTFIFTTYLASQSREFRTRPGAGLAVDWPMGEARTGAAAMAAYVRTTLGAVGYVDYGTAADTGAAKPKLQNRAGEFVPPNVMSFQAAAANAPWDKTPAFALLLVDQPGAGSWPLTAPSFAVLPLVARRPERALAALRFFQWGLRKGASITTDAGYVPLPALVAELVEGAWKRQIKRADGQPVWE